MPTKKAVFAGKGLVRKVREPWISMFVHRVPEKRMPVLFSILLRHIGLLVNSQSRAACKFKPKDVQNIPIETALPLSDSAVVSGSALHTVVL